MPIKSCIQQNLRNGVNNCNVRSLNKASIWASEQLLGMNSQTDEAVNNEVCSAPVLLHNPLDDAPSFEIDRLLFANSLLVNGEFQRAAYMLKKATKGIKPIQSQIGLFLTYYAQYMAGEKLKDQLYSEAKKAKVVLPATKPGEEPKEPEKAANVVTDTKKFQNNYLIEIYNSLAPLYEQKKMDSFLLYLFAVIVKEAYGCVGLPVQFVFPSSSGLENSVDESRDSSIGEEKQNNPEPLNARKLFIESIALSPWNWSCWFDLAALCVKDGLQVPQWEEIVTAKSDLLQRGFASAALDRELEAEKLMYVHFLIHIYLELHRGDLAIKAIEMALPTFPTSLSLRAQIGLAHYAARDYDAAQDAFELIRDTDPYRLSNIDSYSNILYIKERHAELSYLAHTIVKVDKYAPETCCVVGNYYSMKGQHERSITYFQRALSINKQFLSAWTLMGHEFMELKNTATAVTCYREALNISESDFRAWYGLGQAYEMLHLYQYAAYYFKKAAALRPSDARMWSAVGNCLLKIGLKEEAIVTLERAVSCGDSEGISTRELARLCRSEGQSSRAAGFYYKYLQTTSLLDTPHTALPAELSDLLEGSHGVTGGHFLNNQPKANADQAEALLFLAYYHKNTKSYTMAEMFCNKLLNFVGAEGDEARNMLKDMRYALTSTPAKSSSKQPQQQQPTTQQRGSTNRREGEEQRLWGATTPGGGDGNETPPATQSRVPQRPDTAPRTTRSVSRFGSTPLASEGGPQYSSHMDMSDDPSVHFHDVSNLSMSSFGGSARRQSTMGVGRSGNNRSVSRIYHSSNDDSNEHDSSSSRNISREEVARIQSTLFPDDQSLSIDRSAGSGEDSVADMSRALYASDQFSQHSLQQDGEFLSDQEDELGFLDDSNNSNAEMSVDGGFTPPSRRV